LKQIARHRFVAQKTDQDPIITRLIWHYGIDELHSLSNLHEETHFNVLPMAYAWAAGFPRALCDEAAGVMARNYIDAWMCFTPSQDSGEAQYFWQEGFINVWRQNEYDLMTFTTGQKKLIRSLIYDLRNRALPAKLLDKVQDKVEHIIWMRINDKISNADWEANGAKLAIAWVLANVESGNKKVAKDAELKREREARFTASAKAAAESVAASIGQSVLRQVPWHSPLLQGLLEPFAPAATEPSKLMKDKSIVRPHGKPWMSATQFIALLQDATFQADMDELSGALDKMLMGGEDMAMEE
jgi:hypothetical protein